MANTIGSNWAGPLILKMGREEDKQRYIKNILSAEDIWCQGFSEPDAGSDLGNSQCRAVRDGDDYVINGSKIWTSLGTYAMLSRMYAWFQRPVGGNAFNQPPDISLK